jgi:hypothetical protein
MNIPGFEVNAWDFGNIITQPYAWLSVVNLCRRTGGVLFYSPVFSF